MSEKELFEKFQYCFGRVLTPFEIEDIILGLQIIQL